ncbi:hypothetical protein PAAL109150_09185 [Paenibacillus alkaliterrae]
MVAGRWLASTWAVSSARMDDVKCSKTCTVAVLPTCYWVYLKTELEDAFREIYPKAAVQHSVVHEVRGTFPKICVQDKTEFLEDLKMV